MEVISFFWSYNLKLPFEEKNGHWLHFQLDLQAEKGLLFHLQAANC